jgi:hypothetical protein
MSNPARNPLHDPAPGDWLTNGLGDVRVDHVGDGQVYVSKFMCGADEPFDLVRMSLDEYRMQCVDLGARVMLSDDRETP